MEPVACQSFIGGYPWGNRKIKKAHRWQLRHPFWRAESKAVDGRWWLFPQVKGNDAHSNVAVIADGRYPEAPVGGECQIGSPGNHVSLFRYVKPTGRLSCDTPDKQHGMKRRLRDEVCDKLGLMQLRLLLPQWKGPRIDDDKQRPCHQGNFRAPGVSASHESRVREPAMFNFYGSRTILPWRRLASSIVWPQAE